MENTKSTGVGIVLPHNEQDKTNASDVLLPTVSASDTLLTGDSIVSSVNIAESKIDDTNTQVNTIVKI